MITAHVNEQGIVMRFDSPADNLTREAWEALLDELESHHIPGLYQPGKRLHVDGSPQGRLRAVVYFTPQTVTMDEAVAILEKRGMKVYRAPEDPEGL
jgi:hypothetical protein